MKGAIILFSVKLFSTIMVDLILNKLDVSPIRQ